MIRGGSGEALGKFQEAPGGSGRVREAPGRFGDAQGLRMLRGAISGVGAIIGVIRGISGVIRGISNAIGEISGYFSIKRGWQGRATRARIIPFTDVDIWVCPCVEEALEVLGGAANRAEPSE